MCASPYNNSPSSSTSSAIFSGNSLYSITDGTPFILQKTPTFSFGLAFATDFEAGQIFTGKVVSIKEFGAFVEFAPGKEGMVHISKICKERINRVEDVLTLGDKVKVVCLGKDKMGRISFSMKDVPEEA